MMKSLAHRIELIATRSAEIRDLENSLAIEREKLAALYAVRLELIIEALELGASAAYLSEITGNGR